MSVATLRSFGTAYRAISEDIYKFCEAMRFSPTRQQRQLFDAIMRAVRGNGPRRIAVKSGQGPGKTTASAIAGLWLAIQDVDTLGLVTAPTMRQCRDVWLVEVRRQMKKADPLVQRMIEVTKSKVIILGRQDWGIKLVTATKEENAQGYHQENLFVIGEEASGIPREIVTQYKGTLSNKNSVLLLIGNPNSRDCSFYDCFNGQRHLWDCYTWNAEDTALEYPHIVDPQRNKDLAEEFGEDSDVYRVRVKGEFPYNDPRCVISAEDLEVVAGREMAHVMNCVRTGRPDGGPPAKQFGMDFARYGSDETTMFRRSGTAIIEWNKWAHTEPADIVRHAMMLQKRAGWNDEETFYVADAGGMGQGVMHLFYESKKLIFEFHNNGTPQNSKEFANRITEAWFHFARLARKGMVSIPKDAQLLHQLSSRQFEINKNGQMILETKQQYLDRGNETSPDRAEGLIYSFYDLVTATARVSSPMIGKDTGVRIHQ